MVFLLVDVDEMAVSREVAYVISIIIYLEVNGNREIFIWKSMIKDENFLHVMGVNYCRDSHNKYGFVCCRTSALPWTSKPHQLSSFLKMEKSLTNL